MLLLEVRAFDVAERAWFELVPADGHGLAKRATAWTPTRRRSPFSAGTCPGSPRFEDFDQPPVPSARETGARMSARDRGAHHATAVCEPLTVREPSPPVTQSHLDAVSQGGSPPDSERCGSVSRRLVRRPLDAAPAGRREHAGRGLAGQP